MSIRLESGSKKQDINFTCICSRLVSLDKGPSTNCSRPPEAGEESSAFRHRIGLALAPGVGRTVEADGAPRKQEEDKGSERHPERWSSRRVGTHVKIAQLVLDICKESNVNSEGDES